MDNLIVGSTAVHDEFGEVTILERINQCEGAPANRELVKMLAPGQTFYLCSWMADGVEKTGLIPECQLREPESDGNDLPSGYDRNLAEEDALVQRLMANFDFESVVKAVKIMAVVDPENFDYYGDIQHFQDPDLLREVAEKELRCALESLHKYATADSIVKGNEPYWMYQCDGVLDLAVYYTPGSGYDASMKFVLTESSTI